MTEDPRGIVIAGDAVRISYQMRIGDVLVTKIGSGKAIISNNQGSSHNHANLISANRHGRTQLPLQDLSKPAVYEF